MDDVKQALGTGAGARVFRKLSELECGTSYSHRGRYYTLDETARFDERVVVVPPGLLQPLRDVGFDRRDLGPPRPRPATTQRSWRPR
ncbi:MAG: hypothetical protein M0Z95_14715 [Actinomycetota bacterium]|nr:hypothetical protein [Actinomycetota bacterium]